MNPLELLLIMFAVAAGISIATATTVACCRTSARNERDRQLFEAYLNEPSQVESWLVDGAKRILETTLESDEPERHDSHSPDTPGSALGIPDGHPA